MDAGPPEADLNARLQRLEQTFADMGARLQEALAANEELRADNERLRAQNARLTAENSRLQTENSLLREKVDKLARRLFGKSSEKLEPGQLELLPRFPPEESIAGKPPASPCGGPDADTWEAKANPHRPPEPARRRRPRLPEHLPVEETVIEPDEVLAEPQRWRRIGEEISERLDYRPARFIRLRTVRPKYVLKGDPRSIRRSPPLCRRRFRTPVWRPPV